MVEQTFLKRSAYSPDEIRPYQLVSSMQDATFMHKTNDKRSLAQAGIQKPAQSGSLTQPGWLGQPAQPWPGCAGLAHGLPLPSGAGLACVA